MVGQIAVPPEEGTVFDGDTLPGSSGFPDGVPEGTVFSGVSVTLIPTGGGTTGTGGSSSGGGTLNLTPGGGSLPPSFGPAGGKSPIIQAPTVFGGPLTLLTYPSTSQAVGVNYSQLNIGQGGVPPYSYFITAGRVPAGTALITANGTLGNIGRVSGLPTVAGPFSYTVEVQDSSGIVSIENLGAGNSLLYGPSIVTSAPNQLVMLVIITSVEDMVLSDITGISCPDLSFTRILHDESFTYSDSTGDPTYPVASFSVDIFTAPAPTIITHSNWSIISSPLNYFNHSEAYLLVIGGLKDVNNPFDPNVLLPAITENLSGTASAPNTTVSTTEADVTLLNLTVNHTLGAGGGGGTTPVQAPGWTPAIGGSVYTSGGSSSFGALVSSMTPEPPAIQNAVLFTSGFTDNWWYSASFAFVGTGGVPATVSKVISGNIGPVVPGSQTFTAGETGYFLAPPYNTLVVEIYGGSISGSSVITNYALLMSAGIDDYSITTLTPSTTGAPPVGGTLKYDVGTGSPGGEVIFTWS